MTSVYRPKIHTNILFNKSHWKIQIIQDFLRWQLNDPQLETYKLWTKLTYTWRSGWLTDWNESLCLLSIFVLSVTCRFSSIFETHLGTVSGRRFLVFGITRTSYTYLSGMNNLNNYILWTVDQQRLCVRIMLNKLN